MQELIERLVGRAKHPADSVREEMKRTGKSAVGCFLGFCPEELVDAAGFLPVGIWGRDVELTHARTYYPAFFCAPIQQMLQLAIEGEYRGILKAVVMPVYCDALRSAGQNFKTAVPDIAMIPVVYPANRTKPSGLQFLTAEYEAVRERLEAISGKTITDQALEESFLVYDRFRSVMREFVQQAKLHPLTITPYLRHMLIKASFYSDKRAYTEEMACLVEKLKQMPKEPWDGKRLILTGIYLDNEEILREMERQRLMVVSDYLVQESLQFQIDLPKEGKPLYRLAGRFGALKYCSVAADPMKKRIDCLAEEAKKENAAVMVCIPSFCDPEEYDDPLIRKKLESEGIPHLCLELNTNASVSQAATVLQTFAEI